MVDRANLYISKEYDCESIMHFGPLGGAIAAKKCASLGGTRLSRIDKDSVNWLYECDAEMTQMYESKTCDDFDLLGCYIFKATSQCKSKKVQQICPAACGLERCGG